MLSQPASPARLPGYDLREPTEADARLSLERVFGAERAAERWARACHDAGLAPGRVRDASELGRAARALSAQGGPAVAVARSVEIRIRTYARLAAGAAATGGEGR